MAEEPYLGYSENLKFILRGAVFLGYAYGKFSEVKLAHREDELIGYQKMLADQFITGREGFQAGSDKKIQKSLEALAQVREEFPIVNNLYIKCWRKMPVFMGRFLSEEYRPKDY